MKTLTLNLIKKNRVYFKCLNQSGYEVKLKITPKSENLPLGPQDLLVDDVSVRTKYGTDIIYELHSEVQPEEGVVTLKHRYNTILVDKCRDLGGRWDAAEKCWVFPKILESEVEELDFEYNANQIYVEIEALEDIWGACKPLTFLGYVLAKAYGRDSGAVVGDDVALISGTIRSCGSRKNWATQADQGAKFKLKISKNLIEGVKFKYWKVTEL